MSGQAGAASGVPRAGGRATPNRRMDRLAEDFRAGRRPALARAISMAETGRSEVGELLDRLLPMSRRARRFGITGPPGAGKSSLVAGVTALLRERGEDVAVVAVDPTSPFSGGALLGDRIRLNDLSTDPGVFIRSMATRGSLGGLAAATRDVLDLLDAFGFANVLVETVGVGQTELEIAAAADSVAVVLVPESGDGIQAMKAGLMEIADLFVVNKADRPGADRLAREIQQALHLKAGHAGAAGPGHHGVDLSGGFRRVGDAHSSDAAAPARSAGPGGGPEPRSPVGRGSPGNAVGPGTPGLGNLAGPGGPDPGNLAGPGGPDPGNLAGPDVLDPQNPAAVNRPKSWEPPVLKTSAGRGQGIESILDGLLAHRRHLKATGTLEDRRRARARAHVRAIVAARLAQRADRLQASSEDLARWLPEVAAGRATVHQVARLLVDALLGRPDP